MENRELPLPAELWEQIPPAGQAALWVLVDSYEQRIRGLEAEVAALKDRLNQDSQNASRPPASDRERLKRKPPRPPSGRKRGGQPGHPPAQRQLVPVDQVKAVISCKPQQCRYCGQAVHGADAQPLRHQVVEIPRSFST